MPTPTTELRRLRIQARTWAPIADHLLDELGVRPGWRCVDLGCGPIGILDLLARRVGRKGRVIGVDVDPQALLAALVACEDLPNVALVPASAVRTGLARGDFDLVHARLLAQATGAGPLLDEMIGLTRPGGVVVLEEPGAELWEIDPAPAGYSEVAPMVAAQFLRRQYSIGSALPALFRRRGLREVGWRQHRLRFLGGHPYAAMPGFALASARTRLLEAGRLTARQLRTLAGRLEAASKSRRVRHQTFPMWQVWGRVSEGRSVLR